MYLPTNLQTYEITKQFNKNVILKFVASKTIKVFFTYRLYTAHDKCTQGESFWAYFFYFPWTSTSYLQHAIKKRHLDGVEFQAKF